jgi:hypothetical protein
VLFVKCCTRGVVLALATALCCVLSCRRCCPGETTTRRGHRQTLVSAGESSMTVSFRDNWTDFHVDEIESSESRTIN